jgi:hypothetical protein
VKIPARAPLTKQAQRTQVSPGPQLPLRELAYELGAIGVQPARSTESLMSATTVNYSHMRLYAVRRHALIGYERAFRRGRLPASFWAL